jgi:hypothetical protein
MKRAGDGKATRIDPGSLKTSLGLPDPFRRAGQRQAGRRVEGGANYILRRIQTGDAQHSFYLLPGCEDGEHHPNRRMVANQPATCGDKRQGIVKRERSSGMGGGEFANAVAKHQVRPDAPGTPKLGQRDFKGDQRGLCMSGVVQRVRIARRAEEKVLQRQIELPAQRLGTLIKDSTENGRGLIEFPAYAAPQ